MLELQRNRTDPVLSGAFAPDSAGEVKPPVAARRDKMAAYAVQGREALSESSNIHRMRLAMLSAVTDLHSANAY